MKQGQVVEAFPDLYREGPFDDWQRLEGTHVEVRQRGLHVRFGIVESASRDGAAIWLAQHGVLNRMLVHKDEGYQVWLRPLRPQPGARPRLP